MLAGASMGAHTLLWLALRAPERVAGLVVITPAYDPDDAATTRSALARWDALADGLARGGVEGFVAAYGEPHGARGVAGDRAEGDPPAPVAARASRGGGRRAAGGAALAAVRRGRTSWPRSRCRWPSWRARDEADPGHPRRWGRPTRRRSPGARLVLDEPGRSPIAWQGSQLSKVIAEVAAESTRDERDAGAGPAGYSGTPLVRKLGIKPEARLGLIGAPDGFDATLGELPAGVHVRRRLRRAAVRRDRGLLRSPGASSSVAWQRSPAHSTQPGAYGSPGPSAPRACRPTSPRTWSASSVWPPGWSTTRCARSTRCGRACGSSTACATGRLRY